MVYAFIKQVICVKAVVRSTGKESTALVPLTKGD